MMDLTTQVEEKKNKNSGNGIALGACFGLIVETFISFVSFILIILEFY
jgi:hypothetical protein